MTNKIEKLSYLNFPIYATLTQQRKYYDHDGVVFQGEAY